MWAEFCTGKSNFYVTRFPFIFDFSFFPFNFCGRIFLIFPLVLLRFGIFLHHLAVSGDLKGDNIFYISSRVAHLHVIVSVIGAVQFVAV